MAKWFEKDDGDYEGSNGRGNAKDQYRKKAREKQNGRFADHMEPVEDEYPQKYRK